MAMLKKEELNLPSDEIETMIGPSVQVEGDFSAAGDVIVEGTVTGKLKTLKNLRVGDNAKIFASVQAANALISGEIQGNVKISENLELTNTARVFGDIKAKVVTVAPGATFNGKCQIGESKKTKPEEQGKSSSGQNKESLQKKTVVKK
tara:strand:+ start:2412 stop:2855 length:444 start_codon:yes stop_codon:yes gene_type:complete